MSPARFKGTLNPAQLRSWRYSAERMAAGILTGIDYPSPDHVAWLCDVLLDCMYEAQKSLDAAELPDQISDLENQRKDVESEKEAAEQECVLLEGRAEQAEESLKETEKALELSVKQQNEYHALLKVRTEALAKIRATAVLFTERELET